MQPEQKPGLNHTDNYRSETKGFAENEVRRVKEGTSALLVQSGLSETRWREAMECFCCFRNILD